MTKAAKVIFVIGVSGSGKSTIARLLSEELQLPYFEGDDYHPVANIEKMTVGNPLTDQDRLPWLNNLHHIALEHRDVGCVISCSALKQSYRARLAASIEDSLLWIYLKGSYELIAKRMRERQGHFMGEKMLRSQFDTLEEPQDAVVIDIKDPPEVIVEKIKEIIL